MINELTSKLSEGIKKQERIETYTSQKNPGAQRLFEKRSQYLIGLIFDKNILHHRNLEKNIDTLQ